MKSPNMGRFLGLTIYVYQNLADDDDATRSYVLVLNKKTLSLLCPY